MYKFLLILLLFFYTDNNAFGQIANPKRSDSSVIQLNDQKIEFDKLIAKFNTLIDKQSQNQALKSLIEAEDLLIDLEDINLKNAQTTLALSYARAGKIIKAKQYQQLASAKSRGSKYLISSININKLAQSFSLLNDKKGLFKFYEKLLVETSKPDKMPIQIAYANSLNGIDENTKASALLNELYNETPLSKEERAEILNLLIINSIKLNQLQLLEKYYQELQNLNPNPTPNYFLAKGMYLENLGQYDNAVKNYQVLQRDFKSGKRELVYFEGVLQLAQVSSKQKQKDLANYNFNLVANVLQKPNNSTAIGIRYLKLYRAHQLRFNTATPDLDKATKARDSFYKNELINVTKELTYKNKIEQDKQKVELLKKNRAIDKQSSLLIISSLVILLIGGLSAIYILYQRKKQNNLLHLAELERLKQFHKTEVVKTLSISQEAERWRIADQLHDEVGSMISVVRLNLSSNPLKEERISEEKLETANRILADMATTVREMSHELMPVAIRQYGLINAIEQLIYDINTSGKIYIEHLIHGFDDLSKYPEDFQVSFYRIVQEIFQNMVKHSKATNAIFQLMEHPDSINLYIEDNGKGLETNKKDKTGKGIGILATRIDYYEGKISIEGHPGKGTLIIIDIPTAHIIHERGNGKDEK